MGKPEFKLCLKSESHYYHVPCQQAFPSRAVVKNLLANTGDTRDSGSKPGSGRYPGVRNGNRLQYSGLENPMDREAWRATIHWVTKSRTRLKRLSIHAYQYSSMTKKAFFCKCYYKEIILCYNWDFINVFPHICL